MPQPDWRAISFSVVASPPRVGSRRQWIAGTASIMAATSVCSDAVSDSIVVSKVEVLAQRHDRHAVVAQRAGDEDRVAGPRAVARHLDALGHHAHARRVDEDAVALALLHHLGVAGDDRHARLPRGLRHRLDDALEVREREALLEDEAGGEVQRLRARHRHVVHRAVHRQAADVAAGEEERRDDVAVGGHHEAARAASAGAPGRSSRAATRLSKAARKSSSMSCAMARPPLPWLMSTTPRLKSMGRT